MHGVVPQFHSSTVPELYEIMEKRLGFSAMIISTGDLC